MPSAGSSCRTASRSWGWCSSPKSGHRLPQLTTVEVPADLPDGMSEADCRQLLLSRYGIEIGAGAGQLAGKVWRIGCMGHTARRRNVVTLLGALKEVLDR